MKPIYFILALSAGLILGIGQIFYVREVKVTESETIRKVGPVTCMSMSPECGQCLSYRTVGDQCVKEYTEQRRGFPISVGPQANLGPQVTTAIYMNVLIIGLSIPLLLFIISFSLKKYGHITHKKPKS